MLASHTGEELYDDIENAGQNNRPHSWVFVRTELHIMHTDKEIIIMNRRRVIGSEMQEEKPTIKVQTTREKREEVMDCSCNLIH